MEGSGSSALYNVLYDDGDKDDGLREEFVQLVEGSGGSGAAGVSSGRGRSDADDAPVSRSAFKVGDKVTAKYRGKGKWFPGKIVKVEGSGSSALYNVLYDDGDKDDGLREEFVQLVEGSGGSGATGVSSGRGRSDADDAPVSRSAFKVGDKVTAKYRGKGKWFPGKIVKVEGSGSSALYNVLYDDGDKDDGLREEFVKLE